MIKIITGHSLHGGSTISLMNLTELFNKNGYECKMYGPHDWFLSQSPYTDLIGNIKLNSTDIVIKHYFLPFAIRPPVKKYILALKEKQIFPLKNINYKVFDKIQYLNERQKDWHGVDHPYFYVQNPHGDLKANPKLSDGIAAFIGNIDENKQVHKSILRAFKDGYKEFRIYGKIHDERYWINYVEPLLMKLPTVRLMGYVSNRQEIYDSVNAVYIDSISENASRVSDECQITNTKFYGNEQTPIQTLSTDQEILDIWKRELELE